MSRSIEARADFSNIRYAQVWEDADVLLKALRIRPGDRCLSIASAGDNALAMLVEDPAEVVAVDLSDAQLACLGLRIAAYRVLSHEELLGLIGSRSHEDRWSLYERCRDHGGLREDHAGFWDALRPLIEQGIGGIGKFERYFRAFTRWILPMVHPRRRVLRLLEHRSRQEREDLYEREWDTRRWRWIFRVFFSRAVMGRFGRDPEFFRYVEGDVGSRILARAKHAMTALDPSQNPYMHWILTGTHGEALPLALRPEHFDTISRRVDRISLVRGSLEHALDNRAQWTFDRFNLSDIFEYMSAPDAEALLLALANQSSAGARLVYWNMLVPRSRPDSLAHLLRSHSDEAEALLAQDRAFFYSRLVIEEVVA